MSRRRAGSRRSAVKMRRSGTVTTDDFVEPSPMQKADELRQDIALQHSRDVTHMNDQVDETNAVLDEIWKVDG